jgi:AhpC/TSA family
MEYPERRKLEDALDVKADHRRASISPEIALYKMDDRRPGVRYTAGVSQTGKGDEMLRRYARQHLRLLLLLGMLLPFGSLITHVAGSPALPEGLAAPGQSMSMPVFELPDANGATVRSADLQGKVVVLRFWASW